MSPRPYLKLFFRWRMLWGLMHLLQAQCLLYITKHSGVHFVAGHLLMPFAMGLAVNMAIMEVVHRPFGFLLPGGRRYFLKATLCAYALAGIPMFMLARWRSPEFPLLASVGVVLAGMSVALSWGQNYRWSGSRKAAIGLILFVVLCGWRYEQILVFAKFAPWLVAVLSVAVEALFFRQSFGREQMRVRAMDYRFTLGSLMLNRKMMQLNMAQAQARNQKIGRDWKRAPLGSSLRLWSNAIRFEVLGASRNPWSLVLVLLALSAGTFIFVTYAMVMLRSRELPLLEAMGAALHGSLFGEPGQFPVGFMLPVCFMAYATAVSFPNPRRLYPLSRQRMVDLAMWIALRHLAVTFVSAVVVCLGLGLLVCWAVQKPFVFAPAPVFSYPLILGPVTPVLMWMMLRGRSSPSVHAASIGVLFGAMATAVFMGGINFHWIFTMPGLSTIALSTLASCAFFVWRVKRNFLHSDLVVRANA